MGGLPNKPNLLSIPRFCASGVAGPVPLRLLYISHLFSHTLRRREFDAYRYSLDGWRNYMRISSSLSIYALTPFLLISSIGIRASCSCPICLFGEWRYRIELEVDLRIQKWSDRTNQLRSRISQPQSITPRVGGASLSFPILVQGTISWNSSSQIQRSLSLHLHSPPSSRLYLFSNPSDATT